MRCCEEEGQRECVNVLRGMALAVSATVVVVAVVVFGYC